MTDFRKRLALTIQDAGGQKSPVSLLVGDSGLGGVEDENSFLSDYLVPLWNGVKPLVNGVLVSAQVTIEYPMSSFSNNSPVAISDTQERATFSLRPCNTQFGLSHLSLPTIKETIFINSGAGADVDFALSDVQSFALLLENDTTNGGIDMLNAQGAQICQVVNGFQSWGRGK